jgi:hypothetical protein
MAGKGHFKKGWSARNFLRRAVWENSNTQNTQNGILFRFSPSLSPSPPTFFWFSSFSPSSLLLDVCFWLFAFAFFWLLLSLLSLLN